MSRQHKQIFQSVPVLLALVLCGCSALTPKEDPTRHFILTDTAMAKLTSDSQLSVLIGTVNIPQYLDHNEIVTTTAESEVKLADFYVWAEPLDKGVGRVLSANVSRLIDSPNVGPFPQVDPIVYDYRVPIILRRFEMGGDGTVNLEVSYGIAGSGLEPSAVSKSRSRSIAKQVADPTSYSAIAETMSACLADLSREIAKEVLAADRKRKAEAEAAEEAEAAAEAADALSSLPEDELVDEPERLDVE